MLETEVNIVKAQVEAIHVEATFFDLEVGLAMFYAKYG